jgi:hypothetical protein
MPRGTAWANLTQYSDFAFNSSNKLVLVPVGKQWRLVSVYVTFISSATAGNRQLDLLLLDASGNLMGKYIAGAVQAASVTRLYSFAVGHPQDTAFTNTLMLRAIGSEVILSAGFGLRVWDSTAVDAAADDMSVTVLVDERSN